MSQAITLITAFRSFEEYRLTICSSHGTFRPSLKGLVQQNSEEFVRETTIAGFSADTWNDGLTILSKLKGIGPATAALLLSTNDPKSLPFFSDELFRWAFWEDKTGARWDRKIKYSAKEYRELKGKVDELRGRLGREAIEAEKVAYVLGKRDDDLSTTERPDPIKQDTNTSEEAPFKKAATIKKNPPPGSKRKSAHATPANEEVASKQPEKKQRMPAPTSSRRVTRSNGKSKENPT